MTESVTARKQRALRVRSRLRKDANRPRLSIFRSNKYISAQLIDDRRGKTLLAVSEKNLAGSGRRAKKASGTPAVDKLARSTKSQRAVELGKLLGEKALKKGIEKVVFDRGPYRYHGRVKALADAARKAGLKF